MGISVSHSMTCHLFQDNTYEMILTRSLSNDDEKGLKTNRNFDTSLSSIDFTLHLGNLDKDEDVLDFYKKYNKGKFM